MGSLEQLSVLYSSLVNLPPLPLHDQVHLNANLGDQTAHLLDTYHVACLLGRSFLNELTATEQHSLE